MDKDIIQAYLWQDVINFAFSPKSTKEIKQWLHVYGKSLKDFWEIGDYPPTPVIREGKIELKDREISSLMENISFNYSILNGSKFGLTVTVPFVHKSTKQSEIKSLLEKLEIPLSKECFPEVSKAIQVLFHNTNFKLIHHFDDQYFSFPIQSILNKYGKEKEFRNKSKRLSKGAISEYVKGVLDGMIFHPRVHQHIESPLNKLENKKKHKKEEENNKKKHKEKKPEIRIGGGIDNSFLYLFHLRYQFCPSPEKRKMEKDRLTDLFTDAIKNNKTIPPNELLSVKR